MKKGPKEIIREYHHQLALKGARALAAKYSKTTRVNWAKLGGRPRVYPKCRRYGAHRFRRDRCPCGYRRAAKRTKRRRQ